VCIFIIDCFVCSARFSSAAAVSHQLGRESVERAVRWVVWESESCVERDNTKICWFLLLLLFFDVMLFCCLMLID
jgi:hypothetical protein